MKKTGQKLILLAALTGSLYAESPHMIVCTIENYPTLSTRATDKSSDLSPKTTSITPKKNNQGIFGSYFGYIASSSSGVTKQNGLLLFPRKHNDTSFYLVVSRDIAPVFMLHNTISTWQITPKGAYAYYYISQNKDVSTGLYFWNVKKTDLPKDRNLPFNSIMIFAKPDELYVPTGITVTSNSPQLKLPTIYAKDGIDTAKNALVVLEIRRFFESIERSFKIEGAHVQGKTTRSA